MSLFSYGFRFPDSSDPCGHPESEFWSLTGSKKIELKISTTMEKKEFLKLQTPESRVQSPDSRVQTAAVVSQFTRGPTLDC